VGNSLMLTFIMFWCGVASGFFIGTLATIVSQHRQKQ
jgi:hypothetical protein